MKYTHTQTHTYTHTGNDLKLALDELDWGEDERHCDTGHKAAHGVVGNSLQFGVRRCAGGGRGQVQQQSWR